MKIKMNKHSVRGHGLALALALAATVPVHAASEAHGLRVVAASAHAAAGVTVVETRISRTLANRLLSPQRLRVAIVAADGTVRAEQQRMVGPAQLPRGHAGDRYFSSRLDALVAADDRLVVEWVKTAL